MITRILRTGAAAALVLAGAARAEDTQRTQEQQHDAAHAAMHDAMQKQMAMPTAPAQMPGMSDRAAADATRAREHAAQTQQVREAARRRATAHGTQDAAMVRGDGTQHAGAHDGTMQGGGGMMGDPSTTQQGAGMMRTGDMHGGSGGMMPGGGGMMGGSGTSGGGGGMMGGATGGTTTGTGPGTTTGTGPGTGTSPMTK